MRMAMIAITTSSSMSVNAGVPRGGRRRGIGHPGLTGTEPVRAGEAMVEPPNVAMVGYNPSATEPTKVVIFYVSTPDTPFLDPLHH